MRRVGLTVLWWAGCLAGVSALEAAEPTARKPLDARALAARIDFHVDARLKERGVTPAPQAQDAEFFRRLSLDLVGRIPSIIEIRDFLDDERPNKRWIWINDLLELKDDRGRGGEEKLLYAEHFANVYRHLLLPQNNNAQVQFFAAGMENWLREKLKANVGYDKMVRELLTMPAGNPSGPGVFYQANEFKAENLAGTTSRLFLGHKLECAQCHDHPFARWTRDQFWQYAAFFGDVGPARGQPNVRAITIPSTGKVVKARFPDGTEPAWQNGVSPRVTLADWLLRKDNPYFARATVNKVWAYFFGIGLVEPVDEPSEENPPSHPALLDELAREFAAHDFDLKYLVRAVVASRAYQRSSVATHLSQNDPRLFARMAVRGLSPEQLFDSIVEASNHKDYTPTGPQRFNYNQNTPRAQFVAKFPSQDRRGEMETSILQALFMMNGSFMAEVTSLKGNEQLKYIAESSLDPAKRVEQVYLIVLSRKPTAAESARMARYVKAGGKTGSTARAFEDVFWALLNSGEFMLNH